MRVDERLFGLETLACVEAVFIPNPRVCRRGLEVEAQVCVPEGETVVERLFRGGLAFEALRLVYHSTLGSRVIK